MAIPSAWQHLLPRPRRHRTPASPPASRGRRRTRALSPAVDGLERRALQTVVPRYFSTLVSPALLPATGQMLPVRFLGTVASTQPETPEGFFHVTDEYRRLEPFGAMPLTPLGKQPNGLYAFQFDFTLKLQASRSTNTPDGRHYYVLIGARDADNTDGRTVGVFVPKSLPPPSAAPTPTAMRLGQPTPAGPRALAALRRR